jgi:hypothetical protein
MGKKAYRVKKGDDFFKISKKLYGDASYARALMRRNPGFYRLGPGMVLRLPKVDPRITRRKKMQRRLKNYGPPKEDDNPLVRVYNPYMNREEVYDWNTFSDAYFSTAGNYKHNTSVVAPSSDQNN